MLRQQFHMTDVVGRGGGWGVELNLFHDNWSINMHKIVHKLRSKKYVTKKYQITKRQKHHTKLLVTKMNIKLFDNYL